MIGMTAPIVSVLVTSYNRARYIAASIESVLSQTFGDFELLVTDNCSTDGTMDIVRQYERLDPRVRVVVNERNLGQFGNRNRAAELAEGTFLKYHDSDDLMYSYCLDTMVSMMLAHPGAAFGLSNGVYWLGGPCPMLLTPRMCYQREFLGAGMFNAGTPGAIFRTDAFHALGGFADAGAPSDYLFWLRACARVPVLLLPADLFWYRVHPDQELQSPGVALPYARTVRDTWAALFDAECPLTPDEREQARRNLLAVHVKHLWSDVRARRFTVARTRLAAGPTLREWMTYLGRSRRDGFAGTPRDDGGDFLLPRELPAPAGGPRA